MDMPTTTLGDLFDEAIRAGRSALDESTGKQVLNQVGVRTPVHIVLPADSDFAAVGERLKAPYVLKVMSADILHKSDLGGVRLNLNSAQQLREAAREMRAGIEAAGKSVDQWLVEEMSAPGVEVVIGGLQDPEFGPLVMVGLGGIFVEVFRDVAFRICPISEWDAMDMIEELKGSALLKGARGRQAVDVQALADTLLKIGGVDGLLMRAGDRISELDVNPVIVSPSGAVAVDARFILKEQRHAD